MEVVSLLEIVSTEVAEDALLKTDIDDADICSLAILTGSLFVSVLKICTEVSLLFGAAVVEVTDNVDNISILVDTTPVNVIAVVLVLDGTLVDTGDNEGINVILDTALMDVTDGAVVEILVNKLVCLAGVSSLLDSELVLFIDGIEVPSLLEMILTEVAADDEVLETELVNTSDEGVVLGIVEFSLLFVTILAEVPICAEVNVVFDAAVVEVTNSVDIVLLFDTVLVAVIKCEVADCSSFDVILM